MSAHRREGRARRTRRVPLNGACPTDASILDLVGYGAANCSEDAARRRRSPTRPPTCATAPGASTPTTIWPTSPPARLRRATRPHRCTTATPTSHRASRRRRRRTTRATCPSARTSRSRSASRSTCTTRGSRSRAAPAARTTATVSGGPTTFTLDPTADFVQGESCSVTVVGADVTDQDTNDPPDTMAADFTFTFATETAATPIHDVQGATHISPFNGQIVEGPRDRHRQEHERLLDAGPEPGRRPGDLRGHLRLHLVRAHRDRRRLGARHRSRAGVPARRRLQREPDHHRAGLARRSSVLSTGNPLPAPTVIGTGAASRPTRSSRTTRRVGTSRRAASSTPTRTASTSTRASRACACS